MKPYEERKARERQSAAGEQFGRGKVIADLQQPIPDAGRTVDKLAEKAGARWSIVVALLTDPERESARLARLLDALPTERRRHECSDDVRRRQWRRA